MIRLPRIVPVAFSLVAGLAMAGCRSHAPLPLPDAAPPGGLTMSATPAPPDSLVIRPNSSGRVRFVLRNELGQPVPNFPLDFSIPDGSGAVSTLLSSNQGVTDGNGAAVLEVIVGHLPSGNSQVAFSVAATCQGSTGALAYITVTTNAYSVEILPVPDSDLLGSSSVATTRLLFYDDATCGELDLTDLSSATVQPRADRFTNSTSPTVVFHGVAASGNHAVVGLGLDLSSAVQIGGCIDIPGASLLDSATIRATLIMDHLFPVPQGAYQVGSSFQIIPTPPATSPPGLATIQSAWRQWARCPLDPARLWLDCTLDALATDATADPLDCVPVPGAEGNLGDLLFKRRGQVVAQASGTPASATDTPCRGQTDSDGNTSLESLVDTLFSSARSQLQGAKLGALSDEITALLDNIHIDSQLTITTGSELNSYAVEHDLLALTFPGALTPISFPITSLGLPVSSVSGILATFKAGQLSIPRHGFTLRLGTSARYAFEATSLKSRGVQDSLGLVKAIFALAQWTDQGTVLSGCSALDAAICYQVAQSRGCLAKACQSGFDALAARLAGAFDDLDGKGLDFLLSGSGPVVDLDGDERADELGPGLCSAALDTPAGSYVSYGSWTARRATNSP